MASRRRIAKTATEGLKVLWEDNFFRAWRKKDAVVEELAKQENHFSDAELGMALMRAGHLTRRGRRGSYEYIQKYPFLAEANEGPKSKKRGKS
jgi:hypothetical protein